MDTQHQAVRCGVRETKLVRVPEKGQLSAVWRESGKNSLGTGPGSRDFKRTEGRLELAGAVDKNTGHLVKCAFQKNNKHIR